MADAITAVEEARLLTARRQRLNRKANNRRIALMTLAPPTHALRVFRAWEPVARFLAEIGATEPEDYDSDLGNYAGEERHGGCD